jgi:hypothetical protein
LLELFVNNDDFAWLMMGASLSNATQRCYAADGNQDMERAKEGSRPSYT